MQLPHGYSKRWTATLVRLLISLLLKLTSQLVNTWSAYLKALTGQGVPPLGACGLIWA
jgi:hypothetical protein